MGRTNFGGYRSTPEPLTGTTDASGVASVAIPAGRLRRYLGAQATPVATAAAGLFACQIVEQPSTTSDLPTGSGAADVAARTIKVQVSKSNTITTLLLGQGSGLVAAGAGVTVLLLPLGV